MRLALLILASMYLGNILMAQDVTIKKIQSEITRSIKKDINDTTDWKWKRGGRVSVNLTQGSLSNWAAGGDKFSMALNSNVNYFLFFRDGKQNWDNNLDFNFGFVQSTTLGSRKNDDRIDLLSKYGYKIDDGKWFTTGLFNFRSQFFDGYTFSGGKANFASTLFSPAYMLTSIGFDYKPSNTFSAFVSPVTGRWTIVGSNYLSDRGYYGVDSGKHIASEFGAFATFNYNKKFTDNISYKGRMDLFSNYLNNPKNIDIFMTNFVAFKINKYLSATYNLDFIYDDDVRLFGKNGKSPGLQLKSIIGIGFLMRF
jgi:hypothetical protein